MNAFCKNIFLIFTNLTLAFLLLGLSLKAQEFTPTPVTVSHTKINEGGKTFYIHKVTQGQTLYSISKAYTATVQDIEHYNDSLKFGLKTGMELKIPSTLEDKSSRPVFDNSGKYILHQVEKKQTLYAIAKKYNLSTEEILQANPEMINGLKEGVTIKIPQKEIKAVAPPITPVLKDPKLDKKINISTGQIISVNLFLPFYLNQNDSIIKKSELSEADELFPKSVPAVEFFSGFQLACDSLIQNGKKIELNVYDTPADSAGAASFFASKTFKKAAIWFGPFHSFGAWTAAKSVKNSNTLLVLPYAVPNKVLMGNENVIKIAPSLPTAMGSLLKQTLENHKNAHFIVLHNELSKEKQIVSIIKSTYRKIKTNDSIKEVIYKNVGLKGLTSALSKTKNNVIIVASNDQAFVTDIFNKLRGIDEKEYNINIVGMESWINYDNLDLNSIQKLGLQIPSNSYVNYSDTATINFIKQYRTKYSTEPGKYAFSGYDMAWYFISMLSQNGTFKLDTLEQNKKTLLSTRINFKKTGDDSGFENQDVFMLKYEDFELKKQ